ncbi:MAG: heparinase II/III family protein, partial [Candidatus Cloacimonetes bacterium]|nr:heparinase II/III family protein [Candidatus Cloacimonadota bacterium]
MQYYRKIVLSILLLLLVHSLYSDDSDQKPFIKQIGEEFLMGVLQANYRETPIDEILPVNQVPIGNIQLPPIKTHPSLLFKPEKINSIRGRRFRVPYSEWADNIIEATLELNYPADSPLLFELTRSKIAKLNAFAFFLTQNKSFLNEAICALTNIGETKPPDTAEGGNPGIGWGDWMQAAEALQNYAVAYDLVYSELGEDQIIFIEDRFAAKTDQIYKNFTRIPGSLNSTNLAIGFGIPKNNHIIDISCGVATVAMVLDHRNSEKWFKAAIAELQSGLAFILPDGSYREGAYYARFVASRMFPFFFYLNNVTNENLFEHPVINRLNRWLIDLEKSDGSVPDFDDAYPEKLLYQPIAVGLSPLGKELRYLFENNINRFSRFNANFVEAFCAFDDRVKPRKPATGSAVFYPDGGISVFHGNNDIYGLFLGEPGRPYLCNHEHIEPTAFTLSAYGKNFLIDVGYGPKGINDPNRNWYTSAQSHNIPLINGLGPDQNPIWGDDLGGEMLAYFQSEPFSSSTVKAFYRDTEITRTIWFAGRKYFIVIDNLKSEFRNRYSIPWHGLGNIR